MADLENPNPPSSIKYSVAVLPFLVATVGDWLMIVATKLFVATVGIVTTESIGD